MVLFADFPVLAQKQKNSRNHTISGVFWSCWADSNRRPHPYQKALLLFSEYSFMTGDTPEPLVLRGVRGSCFPSHVIRFFASQSVLDRLLEGLLEALSKFHPFFCTHDSNQCPPACEDASVRHSPAIGYVQALLVPLSAGTYFACCMLFSF